MRRKGNIRESKDEHSPEEPTVESHPCNLSEEEKEGLISFEFSSRGRYSREGRLTAVEDLSSSDSTGSDSSEDEIRVELPHVSSSSSSVTEKKKRERKRERESEDASDPSLDDSNPLATPPSD